MDDGYLSGRTPLLVKTRSANRRNCLQPCHSHAFVSASTYTCIWSKREQCRERLRNRRVTALQVNLTDDARQLRGA